MTVHHPWAKRQKGNIGDVEGLSSCFGPVTGSGDCVKVKWSTGATECGSSGAALWRGDQVFGQLMGGDGTCFSGSSWYGRFDLTFPFVRAWLDAVPPGTRVIGVAGSLAFGTVPVGATATRTLTIDNPGNSVLTVFGITYPAGFSGHFSNGPIEGGGSQQVAVTFAPAAGTSYGGAVMVDTDRTSGTATINASGAGDGDGPLTAGVTTIQRIHIAELRDRVNAARASKGLPAFSFTDQALMAESTVVKPFTSPSVAPR